MSDEFPAYADGEKVVVRAPDCPDLPVGRGVVAGVAAQGPRLSGNNRLEPYYAVRMENGYTCSYWWDWLARAEADPFVQDRCTCPTLELFARGCKCGWMERERAARAAG